MESICWIGFRCKIIESDFIHHCRNAVYLCQMIVIHKSLGMKPENGLTDFFRKYKSQNMNETSQCILSCTVFSSEDSSYFYAPVTAQFKV